MAWAPDYVTSSDLKAFLRIGDTLDDTLVQTAVTTASRAVDDTCNRQFGKVDAAEERVYTAVFNVGRGVWQVDIDDLDDTDDLVVAVGDDTLVAGSYTLEPVNAVVKGKVWRRLVVSSGAVAQPTGTPNEVTITAKWGWTTVPVPVKEATLLQASRLFSRRNSPYGVAGSPDQGSELRLLARVDPDVAVALRGYVRPRRVG